MWRAVAAIIVCSLGTLVATFCSALYRLFSRCMKKSPMTTCSIWQPPTYSSGRSVFKARRKVDAISISCNGVWASEQCYTRYNNQKLRKRDRAHLLSVETP
jgi:hypothetical protein